MPQEIVSPSLAVLPLVWLMFTVSFPPAGMKVTRAVFPSRAARAHSLYKARGRASHVELNNIK